MVGNRLLCTLGTDGRLILKWILIAWTVFMWRGKEPLACSFEHIMRLSNCSLLIMDSASWG